MSAEQKFKRTQVRRNKKVNSRLKVQFDETYKGSPFQNKVEPSVTVPSMTLTVKQLMERHTRGIEVGVQAREEIYLPEGQEVPVIRDFNDITEMREELERKEKELKEQIENERETAKRKAKTTEAEKERGNTEQKLDNGKDAKSEDTPPTAKT